MLVLVGMSVAVCGARVGRRMHRKTRKALSNGMHRSCTAINQQVETAAGLDAVAELCQVPHLTGLFVGPMDLALALGYVAGGVVA